MSERDTTRQLGKSAITWIPHGAAAAPVVSSTSAIRATLEKRLEVLRAPEEQLALFPPGADEWSDMDGQEQLETLLHVHMQALGNERDEVKLLLETAAPVRARRPGRESGGPS
jgi:hypothetical protein